MRSREIGDFVLAHMSDDPIEAERMIGILARENLITDRGLHVYLSELFVARRIEQFSTLLADERLGHPDVRLYHRLQLDQYRGVAETSAEELRQIIDRTHGTMIGPALRKAALSSAIFRGDVVFALELLREDTATVSSGHLTGGIRMLLKHGRRDEARALLEHRLRMLDGTDRLYFLELAQELLPPDQQKELGVGHQNWRDVLHQFAAQRDEREDGPLFRSTVADKLMLVPPGSRDLMNIRVDAGERAALLGIVSDALQERRPLSLLRLGDGEAYAFPTPRIDDAFDEAVAEDNRVREIHWWGQHPSEERRLAICESVREAVRNADIVGLPAIYRVIRDLPRKLDLNSGRTNRGLMTVFAMMGVDIRLDGTIFTEERCHQVLFDLPTLQRLVELAERTVVVGCWTKEQLAGDFLDGAELVLIPPQTKVRDAADTSPPLFDVYETIDAEVARLSAPGTLVLVAGGIIGKMFLHTARSRGAVALDIGSVIDYMAGRKTRSIVDLV